MKSNCLIETFKRKIKDPGRYKMYIGIHKTERRLHCWWRDRKNDHLYHFTFDPKNPPKTYLWFDGYVEDIPNINIFFRYITL